MGVFKVLRDLRARVSLGIEQSDLNCTAQILDVTDAHFFLENILPREGMQLLKDSDNFNIVARAEGMYTYITNCQVEQVSLERNLPYYLIPLPDRILYQQRRTFKRTKLALGSTEQGAVAILQQGFDSIRTNLIDISMGGCKISIDGLQAPVFEATNKLLDCELTIPNLLNIEAEVIVRHEHFDPIHHIQTCGIELADMSVTNRRRLVRCIEYLSRRGPTLH